jgi:hypothetical protein
MSRALAIAALLLVGCSPGTSAPSAPTGTTSDPVTVCGKDGQTCVYSPGKLGVCTTNVQARCDGGFCLTCMSVH